MNIIFLNHNHNHTRPENGNFCSSCGYNVNSHNHKKICGNTTIGTLPLGDDVFSLLLFVIAFYFIYKRILKRKKSNGNIHNN